MQHLKLTAQTTFRVLTENNKELSNCNVITFHNKGNTIATIDGSYTLNPGDVLSIEHEPGVIDTTEYSIVFDKYPAPSTTTPGTGSTSGAGTKTIDPINILHIIRVRHQSITPIDISYLKENI